MRQLAGRGRADQQPVSEVQHDHDHERCTEQQLSHPPRCPAAARAPLVCAAVRVARGMHGAPPECSACRRRLAMRCGLVYAAAALSRAALRCSRLLSLRPAFARLGLGPRVARCGRCCMCARCTLCGASHCCRSAGVLLGFSFASAPPLRTRTSLSSSNLVNQPSGQSVGASDGGTCRYERMRACVSLCVCACVRACLLACVCACVCARV